MLCQHILFALFFQIFSGRKIVITKLLPSVVKDIANITKLLKNFAIFYQNWLYSAYQSIHVQFQKDFNSERCLKKSKQKGSACPEDTMEMACLT